MSFGSLKARERMLGVECGGLPAGVAARHVQPGPGISAVGDSGQVELRARLSTTLRIDRDVADFVVTTTDPVCQERLAHMGWRRTGIQTFSRLLSASGDVRRIHETFATHLEEMVLQSARLRPIRWQEALETFVERTEGTSLTWWLYGSGAMAVRGIDIVPRDVDLAVSDPHLVAELLADLLVEPVTNHERWVAEWTGRAFSGALIEWAAHPRDHPDALEQRLPAAQLDTIVWRGKEIPVVPLSVQLEVATRRGLHERMRLLQDALG
jgi:hypothetical protein